MRVLNLYYSLSGNTGKVAGRIEKTVKDLNHNIDTIKITSETKKVEILNYDFVFNGSGVYQWLPGKPMMNFFERIREKYNDAGEIKPGSPKRQGKKAVIYCTYGGMHTGKNEAVPAVKYMGQMFDHLGFTILDEWYIVGKYPEDNEAASKQGRLGNIENRPDERDLEEIEQKVNGILP